MISAATGAMALVMVALVKQRGLEYLLAASVLPDVSLNWETFTIRWAPSIIRRYANCSSAARTTELLRSAKVPTLLLR